MISTNDLAALLAAATPGPWVADKDNHSIWSDDGWSVAEATILCGYPDDKAPHNATLIAQAPTLAAEVLLLTDRITALEVQIAAADRLADEADAAAGTLDCLGMPRPILELKIADFRAAKGE